MNRPTKRPRPERNMIQGQEQNIPAAGPPYIESQKTTSTTSMPAGGGRNIGRGANLPPYVDHSGQSGPPPSQGQYAGQASRQQKTGRNRPQASKATDKRSPGPFPRQQTVKRARSGEQSPGPAPRPYPKDAAGAGSYDRQGYTEPYRTPPSQAGHEAHRPYRAHHPAQQQAYSEPYSYEHNYDSYGAYSEPAYDDYGSPYDSYSTGYSDGRNYGDYANDSYYYGDPPYEQDVYYEQRYRTPRNTLGGDPYEHLTNQQAPWVKWVAPVLSGIVFLACVIILILLLR